MMATSPSPRNKSRSNQRGSIEYDYQHRHQQYQTQQVLNLARTASNSSLTSNVSNCASPIESDNLSYPKAMNNENKPKWNSSTKSHEPKTKTTPTTTTTTTATSSTTTMINGTSIINVNDSTSPPKEVSILGNTNTHIPSSNNPTNSTKRRSNTPIVINTNTIRPSTPNKRPLTPSSGMEIKPLPANSILLPSPTKGMSNSSYSIGSRSTASSKILKTQQRNSIKKQTSQLPPSGPLAASWSLTSRHRNSPVRYTTSDLINMYETHLSTTNKNDRELREALKKLRKMIVENGLPEQSDEAPDGSCSLRGRIWKVLLGIYKISATEYLGLIAKGGSEVYEKIRNDTFRTLATDLKFLNRVDEGMLSRILNAFVWKMKDRPAGRLINLKYSYVQGMNVLAAPFLYVMPELDAFYSFASFIQNTCPLYVQPALEGVHCGLKLMDQCLKVADNELYRFLKSKHLSATVYAFPSIMTFCACTQPLDELCKLWDFLFSYGVHLNVLCVVVQVMHIRHDLLQASSPMKLLRTLPDLNAKKIINDTLLLIPRLHEDLYDMIVRHPFDPTIHDIILPQREDDDVSDEENVVKDDGNESKEDEDWASIKQ